MKRTITLFAALTLMASFATADQILQDKTLVAWVSPANLTQKGGTALTIDDGQSHFDGIVFGELAPRKWMPGSEGFSRTLKEQEPWPEETVDNKTFVQIAVVYRGNDVTVYRNGEPYAHYAMPTPPRPFGPDAVVLFGKRHLDLQDAQDAFTGRIRDARIYDRPLDRQTVAALQPGKSADDLKPWAWWS